ncbi:putative immunity protein [Cellulosimicrobium sp. CUA-896]|uniref:putative immunity protein n=1 Tax=Cellulosimicrobium sp. CUA-896 TaxID=1517881 RepID=UPI0009596610|nr:exonuclease SbcC [Cellulosimicrobium sp. CUA-896]OLT53558.1 exonuclease SbcC [Cellulosimicrobium sp. CUA-896]
MSAESPEIDVTFDELRAVTGFAARCAARALPLYERDAPGDARAREAIDAATAFAEGGARTKNLRVVAFAALKAAGEASTTTAEHAARAASAAAGAAFLHPLAQATQVKHILGAAAHAAIAAELDAGSDSGVGEDELDGALRDAPATVVDVLHRYPPAPAGGGRLGELVRRLDGSLRTSHGDLEA